MSSTFGGASSAAKLRPSSSSMPMLRVVAARSRNSSVSIFSRTRLFTRVISCRSFTGLVRKSSAPASSPRTRSSASLSAVTITTGMWAVRVSLLIRRVNWLTDGNALGLNSAPFTPAPQSFHSSG